MEATPSGKPTEKRRLTEADYQSFYDISDQRPPPRLPRSNQQIMADIERSNGYRVWRIRHDMKWLRKQCKRRGLDPEMARYLL